MISIKCAACGFVGWGDVDVCRKCGAKLVPHADSGPDQVQGFGHNQPGARRSRTELKMGLAIAAMLVGMANLLTLGLFGIGAIVGIVLGIVSLRKISKEPSVYGGKVFATAGLVTSIFSLMIFVPLVILLVIEIPNQVTSQKKHANEGSTILALRKIATAEVAYQSTHGTYGTLDQLGVDGLIDRDLAAGTRHGYKFKIDLTNSRSEQPQAFEAVAVPVEYPTSGRGSFYVDERGVILMADAHGGEATRSDPPLKLNNGYH